MNITQRLIPKSFTKTRPQTRLNPVYITIHETDNEGFKANAEAHARLQENGNSRQASWHIQVDDSQAIQSIPFNEMAWACGDGKNGTGNTQSISIEICVNKDGDFKKAVKNAAEVTKHLMSVFDIPISKVVQHNKWSGKNCPRHLRSGDWGINWNEFIKLLEVKTTNQVGIVGINADVLNVRTTPDVSGKVIGKLHKGGWYKCYGVADGWYNVGSGWVSGKYVTFKKL